MKATHEISACYFPWCKELELTFADLETGKSVSCSVKVDKETGEAMAEIVPPCSYHPATVKEKQ